MFRYKLRTLLIVLAVLVPSLAWGRSERHDYRERAKLRQAVRRACAGCRQAESSQSLARL